jgi:hypothetical protein
MDLWQQTGHPISDQNRPAIKDLKTLLQGICFNWIYGLEGISVASVDSKLDGDQVNRSCYRIIEEMGIGERTSRPPPNIFWKSDPGIRESHGPGFLCQPKPEMKRKKNKNIEKRERPDIHFIHFWRVHLFCYFNDT